MTVRLRRLTGTKKQFMQTLYEALKALKIPTADGALTPLRTNGAPILRFRPDGTFRILFLPDSHYDSTLKKEAAATVQCLRELLDEAKPDLLILGGDNVRDRKIRSYCDLLRPVLERELPWTMVFGNHDEGENEGTKETTLAFLQTLPGCLAYDADPALTGCTNHVLPVYDRTGSVPLRALWMLDTGNHCAGGYDGVRRDQLRWFIDANMALTAALGGETIPGYAFQHMIPQEPTKRVFLKARSRKRFMVNYEDGTASARMMNFFRLNGLIFEHAGASSPNHGEWAILANGGVNAMLVGHDHNNCFSVTTGGMTLLQCPGYSWCVYGHDLIRGARTLTLKEDPAAKDTERMIFTYDLARKPDSRLPEMTGTSRNAFLRQKRLSSALFAAARALSAPSEAAQRKKRQT